MDFPIRRLTTVIEERFQEAGQTAAVPLRKIAVIAVVPNPNVDKYVEDLTPMIEASEGLGHKMAAVAFRHVQPNEVQGYGKGGIVGLRGELEHANALLTTKFANPFRERIGRSPAWISSMTKVAAPGTLIDIPMNATTDTYVRSHYNGMSFLLPDAPMPDEIALIFCMATGGRLSARVGGMTYAESLTTAHA